MDQQLEDTRSASTSRCRDLEESLKELRGDLDMATAKLNSKDEEIKQLKSQASSSNLGDELLREEVSREERANRSEAAS